MLPDPQFGRFRTGVLLILAMAFLGTLAELVLLEHYEDWQQRIPLAVLTASALVLAWHAARRDAASRRVLQACMGALVVAGVAGVVLHLEGNLEFEREISPELAGLALWLEVARGATPALAPGSLIPFGLLGLLYARLHPLRTREDP
jgi:hypothetical protein